MITTVRAAAFGVVALASLATGPAFADQAVGYTTPHHMNVELHAGPATRYPIIGIIPADKPIVVHGCASGDQWCDVEWRSQRGWVYKPYLEIEGRVPYFFWFGQPYLVP